MEGLVFGGAYVQSEICVSKSIGLAFSEKEIYHFCFVLYSEGRFNGGFFALRFCGAYIWRGLFSEFYGISFLFSLFSCPSTSLFLYHVNVFCQSPYGCLYNSDPCLSCPFWYPVLRRIDSKT